MIVLIGESASGKTAIERELIKRGMKAIITYTTRPMRQGEADGVDYHFITRSKFEHLLSDGFFIEHTEYNRNFYGIAVSDCVDDSVVVVDPNGLRSLHKHKNIRIKSFYIAIPETERLHRMIKRGDNEDSIMNRLAADRVLFNGLENEVDFVLDGAAPVLRNTEKIMRCLD